MILEERVASDLMLFFLREADSPCREWQVAGPSTSAW